MIVRNALGAFFGIVCACAAQSSTVLSRTSYRTDRFGCNAVCELTSVQRRYLATDEATVLRFSGSAVVSVRTASSNTTLRINDTDVEAKRLFFDPFLQASQYEVYDGSVDASTVVVLNSSSAERVLIVVGDPSRTVVDFVLLPYTAWLVHGAYWTQEQVLPIFAILSLFLGAVVRITRRRHTVYKWLTTAAIAIFLASWSDKTYHLVRAMQRHPIGFSDLALCVGVSIILLDVVPGLVCAISTLRRKFSWRIKLLIASVLLAVSFFGGGNFVAPFCGLAALLIRF